ncbi:MAG TPA: hypothetical protein VFV86_09480 [Nitrososphaeraceae archaeon]|nr:hypothetical protein [Nitrososphaeraceae archaeon]
MNARFSLESSNYLRLSGRSDISKIKTSYLEINGEESYQTKGQKLKLL